MFRRFINLPLKRLWVGHQPSPYIQPWPLVKSNGSAFSHHQTTFFQDDPPMSYDILTNDLCQSGSSPSIRQVPQKVCIVGEVHSLKVCGCRHPGSCIFISQMGRLYHKESGRGKRESRPDVCQRARRFRERSNGKINKRLRDLMNDGVDGLDKGIEKNERINQMKRSSKKKYSPSSSHRSYPDDKEAYLEFQKPKRTFKNFVTMLMSKGRKVRQQLQEGKDADLLRYHSDNKALMKHYKNKIKYKRQITQRQLKAKPQVPKAKYNDDSIDWTFFENSLNPQKQDAFFPFKTKPKSTGRAKDKEISSHSKPILPHSLEVIKEREEKLISKAKKETEGRLPCLRESSFKPGNQKNVSRIDNKNMCVKCIDPQVHSSSAEQKVDYKRVNENIMESSSNNSSGQKIESGLKITPPDIQKPTGFYDTLKSRIPCDNISEKKDCKAGLKPPNTGECISKMPCPRSIAGNVDNQPRSGQSDNNLHKVFKNRTDNNLWCSPEKDIDKGDIKSKKEGDFSKFFSMLDDKDKLKFRVAELMARCMFLVEKRMQQDLDGSKVCNVKEKDNNVNQLVESFWRHYIQCCECQKMDDCARSKSSMLGNTEKGIINKVDIIIKQCTHIKEVIEARSLKNQCIKHGLSQSIVEEFCKAKAKLENMSANEKLKTESNEFGLNRNCAIESLNDKCQERNNFVEDVLTKMSSECKTSDKYEQDLLSKMKLAIKELQKKLAEDKQNIISKKHNQNNLFSENKLNGLNKCAEEELKSKCAEEELKEKCAKEALKEKCAEEELREMCAIEELKEKCAEEELKEKCATEELKKACAEEELKRICAENELKEKCAEQELKEKCALKEFRELRAEEELKQKCAEKDFKDKCSDENLKERCSLKEQQRQCEEFSLRKRCAEFALKKKCENNNGGNFLNLLGEPKKYSNEYKNSKKISTDEKPKKNSTEKDQNRSTLGKLKEKVRLTGKNNGNVNKFMSTKANKWHQSFGRRKISVKDDIQNWGLIKKILDKEDKAMRNKGLQHGKPSELEGLGIFLRSALSRLRRRPQRGLEDEHCTDDRKRFFNPRQWSLFPGLAPLYYQTLRRSPLLENNFLVRQLLPNLKPLAINDYLGVFWLHPLNSCNPFGKRCYKRDDFCNGSSFLYPITEMSRRNFKDGVVKNN